MSLRRALKSFLPVAALAVLGGPAMAADPAPAPSLTTKPAYPLTTCVVSGEKLGEMGKPVVVKHEGREVQLCCKSCQPEFQKEPAKYLKKLDEAAKKPTTQPSKKAEPVKTPHAHPHH